MEKNIFWLMTEKSNCGQSKADIYFYFINLKILMNKILFSLTLMTISVVGLAQSKTNAIGVVTKPEPELKWITQINKLVKPHYSSLDSFYTETHINGLDLMIAVVSDTSERDGQPGNFEKIFIFKKVNNQLEILDASAEYERDGRGPHVVADGDSLMVSHSFHRGYNELTYKWNSIANEYLLVRIEGESTQTFSKKGIIYFGRYNDFYDIKNQILTEESEEYPEEKEEKSHPKVKNIHKKLPSTISLKLKDMKDPNEYDDLL